jgi:hypothetical protein
MRYNTIFVLIVKPNNSHDLTGNIDLVPCLSFNYIPNPQLQSPTSENQKHVLRGW